MDATLYFTAKYLIFVGVLAAGVYWLTLPRKDKLRFLVFGLIATVSAYVLSKIGSALYYDPRPFVTHAVTPLYPQGPGNGFPSDHTLFAGAIAVTIFATSKRMGAIFFAIALLIGVGNVVGHIQSPIDIVGSIVFALLGGAVACVLTPRVLALIPRNKKDSTPSTPTR